MNLVDVIFNAAAMLPLLFILIIMIVMGNWMLRLAGKSTRKTIKTFTK